MDVSELAMKTIELLEDKGWTQGHYTNDDGQHCLVGAIFTTADGHDSSTEYDSISANLIDELVIAARRKYDSPSLISLTWWNDQPNRTKEEVIDLLLTAV